MENDTSSRVAQIEVDEIVTQDVANIRDAVMPQPMAKDLVFIPKTVTAEAQEIPQFIAVDAASETTGSIVCWSLSGMIDRQDLDLAQPSDLDSSWMPAVVTAKQAFSRACKDQASKHLMVRSHPKKGWALVRETTSETDLDYKVAGRAYLDKGEVYFEGEVEPETKTAIVSQYSKYMRCLDRIDVSNWLTYVVERLHGLSLRSNSGGMYFLPVTSLRIFRAIKGMLRTVSVHKLYEYPAMRSEDAIEGIMDAIRLESDQILSEVNGALVADELTAKTVVGQIERVEGAMNKVRSYERLLNIPMTSMILELAALRVRLLTLTSRSAQLEVD